MTSREFERFVFIELPGEKKPVPAGLFTLDAHLGVGTFQYGLRYARRPNAIAIDPVNLPLTGEKYVTRKNGGIFGILRDVLPDSWGRYILAKQLGVPFGTQKDFELIDLLTVNAVGALSFGKTPEKATARRDKPVTLPELAEVAKVIDQAMEDQELPPEVLHLLRQGTSLGGAQPKCTVVIDSEEWIAKFTSSKTAVQYPGIEYATMTLAARAGIRVPAFRLESVAGRPVFLIKRFDRDGSRRLPFMSAFALSNLDIDELERGSYPEIATRMRTFVSQVREDHHELFRRMAFNMFVRNEDDHLRNHGFVFKGAWRLSPAYDIVPVPSRRTPQDSFHLSLQVGDQGSLANMTNLLSQCQRFSLRREQALEIIERIEEAVQGWEQEIKRAGVSRNDREAVRWCFEGFRKKK
ncbi:MAG: type II toxin-antitoxin system HipA family toxin [Proteobacteria bacterium]|nr:type II toxin-antitoxin system HipA family toxin [Pseudomonadota bacterium]MBU4296216.1 type II toxin-antitoxin system HipA family toxin [Pseudomonadota bacterium]MCG2746426.1 type II toxin-antitoxin system HipA family toxin [Desulfobulbaceae bacterium]